jgi:hypothetical protein
MHVWSDTRRTICEIILPHFILYWFSIHFEDFTVKVLFKKSTHKMKELENLHKSLHLEDYISTIHRKFHAHIVNVLFVHMWNLVGVQHFCDSGLYCYSCGYGICICSCLICVILLFSRGKQMFYIEDQSLLCMRIRPFSCISMSNFGSTVMRVHFQTLLIHMWLVWQTHKSRSPSH